MPSGQAAYESRRRNAATKAGRALERMTSASVPTRASSARDGSGSLFVFFRSGKLMYAHGSTPADVRVATGVDQITAALSDPGAVVVVPDRDTIRKLIRRAELGGATTAATARRLRFSQRVAVSSRAVVLTQALSSKYFLPIDEDQGSIGAWLRMLAMPRDPSGMVGLFRLVTAGAPGATKAWAEARKGLLVAEETASGHLAFGGASAAASVFFCAEKIEEQWSAMQRMDENLFARFFTDGSVVRATPFARNGTITCRLSTPMSLKEGTVLLTAPASPQGFCQEGRAKLVSLRFEAGGLVGEFDSVRSSVALFSMFDFALNNGTEVLVTSAPGGGPGAAFTSGNWFGQHHDLGPHLGRDVPLDVALAGVPLTA